MSLPDQNPRLLRSIPEGITSFIRCNPSLNSFSQGNSGSLASFTVNGPIVRHQDFSGSLQGVHIQIASSPDDADSRAEPSAADHVFSSRGQV